MTKLTAKALSKREEEVLGLILEGKSVSEIATDLKLAKHTISTHKARLMHKLGIFNIPGLVIYAIKKGDLKVPGVLVAEQERAELDSQQNVFIYKELAP